MVQAIAEGTELLAARSSRRTLAALFGNWGPSLGIRQWLVELMRDALRDDPNLRDLST